MKRINEYVRMIRRKISNNIFRIRHRKFVDALLKWEGREPFEDEEI
jgi:hypothetical protein